VTSAVRVLLAVLAWGTAASLGSARPLGDIDCDNLVTESDLHTLMRTIFSAATPPCDADVNGDGRLDGSDVIALVQVINAQGPEITHLGLASADGFPAEPLGEISGRPVYFRNIGSGFRLVVEGKAGPSGLAPGLTVIDRHPRDPSRRPDIQVQSTLRLGNGNADVCQGGVPGIVPPDFGPTQVIADALNDFGCHFTSSTSPNFACTQNAFGELQFVSPVTQAQFCAQIAASLAFTEGDSVVSVRLRDSGGNLGSLRQLIIRVASGPPPPTFTSTPTPTPVTPSPSATPTPTPTLTRSPTPGSASVTPSPTSTRTLTPTGPTPTVTPTTPRPPTQSPTRSHTPSRTPTASTTPTRTPPPSPTPSPTPAGPIGPIVTFFGLLRADAVSIEPDSSSQPGTIPIYTLAGGTGFWIVVEGGVGPSGSPVGRFAYLGNPTLLSDLQVQVTQPLGNASPEVCDRSGSNPGGVPAINPPSFDERLTGTINDLACRFVDGSNDPVGRRRNEGCVKFLPSEEYGFVSDDSDLQFCSLISGALRFPPGDTLVTARLRDEDGHFGAPAQLIVHVLLP
jgi:hypothetical protein